jgi:hypothetical protein
MSSKTRRAEPYTSDLVSTLPGEAAVAVAEASEAQEPLDIPRIQAEIEQQMALIRQLEQQHTAAQEHLKTDTAGKAQGLRPVSRLSLDELQQQVTDLRHRLRQHRKQEKRLRITLAEHALAASTHTAQERAQVAAEVRERLRVVSQEEKEASHAATLAARDKANWERQLAHLQYELTLLEVQR